MATLARPSPSPSPPLHRRSKSWARRCERYCCSCLSLFPLSFVYGLTTWAVWAQASMGFTAIANSWTGTSSAVVGIIFYTLLNWSYTTAVFTHPGTPLSQHHVYSSLPTHSPSHTATSFTVKSTGEHRFCKKCQTRKPDRAHHCSTCGRCVLKMDHHCPWLATCVGLRNYKPFVLFLVYTCLFCYTCFATSAKWTWGNIVGDNTFGDDERLMPVNYILLAVLSGILGLVLSGFTGWHLYLALAGQTTIESLEKTRYLSPVHKQMKAQLSQQQRSSGTINDQPSFTDQLREIHANALPSVTRPEEGEGVEDNERHPDSPAHRSLHNNYSELEAQRERDRYDAYLDETDSEKLPNAFDLGWRKNLRHVFGNSPVLWMLPICNTTGDGWTWEASSRWVEAREELARERKARQREGAAFEDDSRGWTDRARAVDVRGDLQHTNGQAASVPRSDVSLQTLDPRDLRKYDDHGSSDEDEGDGANARLLQKSSKLEGQWNDLPADMLAAPTRDSSRGGPRTRSPRPARAYPNR